MSSRHLFSLHNSTSIASKFLLHFWKLLWIPISSNDYYHACLKSIAGQATHISLFQNKKMIKTLLSYSNCTVVFPARRLPKPVFYNSQYILIITQVTTKGAGLNPNAKVWQEIPAHQDDNPEGTEDSPWLLTYPPPTEMTDGMSFFSSVCRQCFLTSVYLRLLLT